METDWVHINGWEIALVGKVSQRLNSKPCYILEWFLVGPFEQVNQYKSLKGLTAPSKEAFSFQCLFITATLLGIGSSMRFYFIASSTRVLTYLAAPKWVEIPSKNISDKAFWLIFVYKESRSREGRARILDLLQRPLFRLILPSQFFYCSFWCIIEINQGFL